MCDVRAELGQVIDDCVDTGVDLLGGSVLRPDRLLLKPLHGSVDGVLDVVPRPQRCHSLGHAW